MRLRRIGLIVNMTIQKWGIKADFKNKLNVHSIYF